jgi:hypothetical protein
MLEEMAGINRESETARKDINGRFEKEKACAGFASRLLTPDRKHRRAAYVEFLEMIVDNRNF